MANPQHEDGHLKIADTLVVAICREDFTAVQLRLLLAIMNMTYRVGKTKAAISQDDLRYATGAKGYKVQTGLGNLIDRKVVWVQHLVDGSRLVGIQKDYDLWLPKMGTAITSSLNSNSYIPPVRALPKMGNNATPPGKILTWMLSELNVSLTIGAWRKEYSKMVDLYTLALDLNHTPIDALRSLKDYFEDRADPGFRARVTRPASYLLVGYRQWRRSIPTKPRSIREDEQLTGYRHKYDTRSKQWRMSSERIKPSN